MVNETNGGGSVEKLGKYIIESELGQGAMGVVYKARDPFINRMVAIKTIRKNLLDNEEVLARFQREAQVAGKLSHPNIVSIYEYGEEGNTAYIVMEFVQGRELKKIFDENERIDLSEIVRIMSQILGALSYSHNHGIIHRDIKPENIILTDRDQVKIMDFGVAHVDSSNLTKTGAVLGTPKYMSPEQFMGHKVDGRSDIFCVGVILYQFITGENPFDGRTMATVMHKVLTMDPIDPEKLNFQIPRQLNDVIKKAISKKPDDRYQTTEEFYRAINTAIQSDTLPKNAPAHEKADDPAKTVILSSPDKEADDSERTLTENPSVEISKKTVRRDEESKPRRSGKWLLVFAIIAVFATGFFLRNHIIPSSKPQDGYTAKSKTDLKENMVTPSKPKSDETGPRLREPAPPAPKPEYGHVNLITRPWTTVYIGNKSYGNTPIAKLRLSAGKVEVRFVNKSKNIDKIETIIVKPNETVRKRFDWK